jgi:predicted nucleic acid-binding protein
LWDISKWDEAKWTAEDELFDGMLTRLIELDGKDRGDNQRRDILIAETATKNGLILLSADRNLRMVTTEFGGRAMQPPR